MSHEQSHPAGPHPEFPDISDDAAPTVTWWPWLGVTLLLMVVVAGLVRVKSAAPAASDAPTPVDQQNVVPPEGAQPVGEPVAPADGKPQQQ